MIFLAAVAFLATVQTTSADALCKPDSRAVANGAVLTVRSTGVANPEQACEILVRDRKGRTLFSDRGFSAEIHPATGRDIDNDGRPDAVVGVDTGGANHCCWEYPVLSFNPTPRVLLRLPTAS